MEALVKCKRQRGGHRAYVKKCISTIKGIISDAGGESASDIKNRLLGYQELLSEKKSLLQKFDDSVLELLEEEADVIDDIFESSEFSEFIKNIEIDITIAIEKLSAVVISRPAQPDNELVSSAEDDLDRSSKQNNDPPVPSVCRAKLPKLIIKQFNGDPKLWQSFWDSFSSAVHSNTGISKVDKFNYLKSYLGGLALSCISGLSLTESNYDESIKILTDRFGNLQIIISSHMDALINLPAATNVLDSSKVRALYDAIEIHIRSLKTLGVGSENYGSILIPIILNKLPEELKIIISRKSGQDKWCIDDLLSTLKVELVARENIQLMSSKPSSSSSRSSSSSSSPKKSTFDSRPNTASTLFLNSKANDRVVYCVFCRDQHPSAECPTVTDIAERRARLRRRGKCFVCLRSGHVMRRCQVNYNCFNCGGRHNRAICDNEVNEQTSLKHSEPTPSTNMCIDTARNTVLLQTAVANTSNTEQFNYSVQSNLLFDSCSQLTYITETHRQRLKLKTIGQENLLIKIFGEEIPKYRTCDIVRIAIACRDGMQIYVKAFCVPNICSPVSDQSVRFAIDKYPHLQGLSLANSARVPSFKVDVLIGADYYWNFFVGEIRRGEPSSPVALNSKLGWILSGPVSDCRFNDDCTVNLSPTHVLHISAEKESTETDNNLLKNELNKFWDLETIGIRKDESDVLTDFIQDVKFNQSFNMYEAKLPFKDFEPILSDMYFESSKRLGSLLYRLKKKPEVLSEYDRIINEQLSTGIISSVPNCNVSNLSNFHYLPHREVLRLDKETTKLRVVYDASAKGARGLSLNDCLFSGPSLNPLIFDILLRFRMNHIAVIADIEKAFLNILIAEEHRDYLRFLWVDDPFKDNPIVKIFRFNRVVFGVKSSPFILNATIKHHLTSTFDNDIDFVNRTLRSLYVDDFASGSFDVQSTFDMCKRVKLGLQSGGFNLRKWVTNSPNLMRCLEESEIFPETVCNSSRPIIDKNVSTANVTEDDQGYNLFLENNASDSPSVLGQKWNCQADEFLFEFDKILSCVESSIKENQLTKRNVLSITAKFYDPVGLIAPIVLLFKLCFQSLCKRNVDWDEPLDTNFTNYWLELVFSLSKVKTISISRCICPNLFTDVNVELHVFGDSSEKAYGCAAYIRCIHASGEVHCNLIASKSRVVPMGKMTIPRLELLACLISVRLSASIREALSDLINFRIFYWSDSTVALSWIKNVSKEFKQFVQNRVTEIRRLSSPDDWNYVPTSQNPSDIVSRGCKAVDLIENNLWWHGPTFLLEPNEHLQWSLENPKKYEDVSEEEKTSTMVTATNVSYPKISLILDVKKFSRLSVVLRITAYVLRYIHNLKCRIQGTECRSGELTANEILEAEYLWIKEAQIKMRCNDKFHKQSESLNLQEDENGLLRCHGRLQNCPISYDAKYPIILESDHYFTSLIIKECHERVYHNGVQETLVQLRSRFWVIRGRQVVKSIINNCILCKKLEGKSYGVPIQPQLPKFRVSDDFGFSKLGIDYAGPLYVKDIYSNSGNMHKAFIALYTCASTRAVHLDLVPDATSESFIKSFKRFIGRRGVPSFVISDNGKTFKSAELRNFLTSNRITWNYNIERSPWWGGFFERMVRSTKRCLKKTIGNARFTYEELLTLIVEIEGVLNSRPLTYVNEDGGEPLTPSHLIIGHRLLSQACGNDKNVSSIKTDTECRKRNSYIQKVLNHFWNRWRKDYLTSLREHHRMKEKKGPVVHVGDVVIVQEDKVPRLNWSMARVEKTFDGRDGKIRAAEIRVHDKAGKPIVMNRPVQKLFPIELMTDN